MPQASQTLSASPMLFLNGRILTGEQLLSAEPRFVSALLVQDGIVIATGSTEELLRQAPAGAVHVDLEGAFAMPGFNDAHLHLGEGARLRREVDLSGARSLEEALARIADAAAGALPGAWLTGGGWDETLWRVKEHGGGAGHALPTRDALDRVTGDHPAVFARIDVHLSAANSLALRRGGVTCETIAPAGSAIDHDAAGEPTGILRERAARALVERHIPSATPEERKRGLRLVLAEALAFGITSVQDNSADEDFAALCALHGAGELPLRVSEWLPFDAPLAELEERRARAPRNRFLRTTMLKAFLDGSLGSRTAALLAPYADAPATTGIPLYTQERLTSLALERAAAGFQLGFHAIGDHALEMALQAFAAVQAASAQGADLEAGGSEAEGRKPQRLPVDVHENRFRIEHAQTAAAHAFAQAHAVHAIASMQPSHLLTDARWVAERLGAERSAGAYAWRSFAAAGVALAFGTDFPVEPLTPFRGLYAAVTRRGEPRNEIAGEDSGPAFFPEQRLTMAEAIHAYTQGAAFAEGTESWKGLLCPGYAADFVVLDRDLLAFSSDAARGSSAGRAVLDTAILDTAILDTEILDTKVLRTVVDGKTVFQAPAQPEEKAASQRSLPSDPQSISQGGFQAEAD